MTTGGDHYYTYYGKVAFLAENEARWAVFLDNATHGRWEYDSDGWAGVAPAGILPRLRLSGDSFVGELYLEVRTDFTPHIHSHDTRRVPEVDEPCVFLAVGGPPTDEQIRTVGWWDPDTWLGVRTLTGNIPWDDLFNPNDERAVNALKAAREQDFGLTAISGQRAGTDDVTDIPEREREDDQ